VFRCETELAFPTYRTQLVDPADIENVKKVQAGYKRSRSRVSRQPAPKAAPAIDFAKPLAPAEEKTSPQFFNILNFVLQFCRRSRPRKHSWRGSPGSASVPARPLNASKLSPEMKTAIEQGMADAWVAFAGLKKRF